MEWFSLAKPEKRTSDKIDRVKSVVGFINAVVLLNGDILSMKKLNYNFFKLF